MKPTDFASNLTTFLGDYLPAQRNACANTISSYAQTFSLLIRFCRDDRSIRPQSLTIDMITPELIIMFLKYLEKQLQYSISSRNQRLSAIRSFFRYLQEHAPARLLQCQRILAIPGKKVSSSTPVDYLSMERTKNFLSRPDLKTKAGRRYASLLALLYDAGLRVQELIGLSILDVRFDSPAQIKFFGKGRKYRVIPLMPATCDLLKSYLKDENCTNSDRRLFLNHQHNPLTRAGIRYIINKFARATGKESGDTYQGLHPHIFRHSKAMHLLQAGNPLSVIQSFLGHEDIRTTMIYAKADLEMTRAALEKMETNIPKASFPSWLENPDILAWLRSL